MPRMMPSFDTSHVHCISKETSSDAKVVTKAIAMRLTRVMNEIIVNTLAVYLLLLKCYDRKWSSYRGVPL